MQLDHLIFAQQAQLFFAAYDAGKEALQMGSGIFNNCNDIPKTGIGKQKLNGNGSVLHLGYRCMDFINPV